MTGSTRKDGHEQCGGAKRSGGLCAQTAGWGTSHPGVGRCKLHGGSTPSHERSATRELARRECLSFGLKVEIDPASALIEEVWRTQAQVEFYEGLVAELPIHPEPDEKTEVKGGKDDGKVEWKRGRAGIYGRDYHVSGIPTGDAKPHVLVVLYNEERKHLAAVTTAALKAGVAAARVQLEREQAKLIAIAFRQFAVALGHDPAAPEVREAARGQLQLIAGGRS